MYTLLLPKPKVWKKEGLNEKKSRIGSSSHVIL